MSQAPRRRTANAALVARMLEHPELLEQVRTLPAPVIRRAIQQVGLEDAGELAVLLSLDQLREVFDEDLWQSPTPGADEVFDTARFVTWLEVLYEGGAPLVADRLAELSEEFRVAAFSQLVRVFDRATIDASVSDEDEINQLDKAFDAQLCQELDDYVIVARIEQGWDALWDSILALDARHPDLLRAALGRCWHATREEAKRVGGYRAVLLGDEYLLEDASAEREDRRSARGHISPADARAFLALAAEEPASPKLDPITHAYFRDLEPAEAASSSPAPSTGERRAPLLELLAESEADLEPTHGSALAHADSPLRDAMAALADSAPDAHQRVVQELAYLANVLVAGDRSREWQPAEAAEEVLQRCDRGLRALMMLRHQQASELLGEWGAVGVFRAAGAPALSRE